MKRSALLSAMRAEPSHAVVKFWAVSHGLSILQVTRKVPGTPFVVPKLAMEIMGMMGTQRETAMLGGFACGSDECKGLILRIWSFLTRIAPSQPWGCHGGFFRGVTMRVWCFHRRGQNSKGKKKTDV